MGTGRWSARLGLAGALIVAGGCFVVLATSAANDRRVLATQPGQDAPELALPVQVASDAGEQAIFRLSDQRGTVVVLYFCSEACPVSNDYEQRLMELSRRYADDCRVRFVAVHTTPSAAPLATFDAAHPPVLIHVQDSTGIAAAEFCITRTPTFLVIDESGAIRYRGAFDDNRNAAQATTGHVESAIRQILAGQTVHRPLTEVFGCPTPARRD